MHAFHLPDLDPDSAAIEVRGPERDHAVKSRRLRPGEQALLLDGRGTRALAEVDAVAPTLRLRIVERTRIEPVAPAVDVWSPPPKGPRAGDMIDALSQVGGASWTPMNTAFAATEATNARLDRLERVAIEAMKQSQRAWLLALGAPSEFDDGLAPTPGTRIVLADASGGEFARNDAARVRLLIGPEGGWRPDEIDRARTAGASVCRFGPHVMRIEVAAPVATAIVLAHAQR
ncbi:MAG: RsmE family RNA methyltransferase [Phycisphaerales bacterium]